MAFHDRSRRLGSRLALSALITWIVLGSFGCGSRSDQSAGNGPGSTNDSTAVSGDEDTHPSTSASAGSKSEDHSAATSAAAAGNVVRLVDKGCIQFEPHWIEVAPGQSITWQSELKEKVTIHVDAGGFGKTEFVVAPGAKVVSGPAGTAKDYKVWTEPAACQGAPLGARGSGPGVSVGSASGH